ncbi:protein-L-isoaspartate O-methyltransferase [Lysobacter helvus]|uniref:Protein-L-isoaspartate O-methyltransferase n=2 Tax=Lysobacteraceae TaxID=32033 RepID=A0ABN6FSI4_9GAMM|nr:MULTISPECIES: protein-L-isoaspartate O-methyltransferase [Lysobacter]BCT92651.1 protein-L-isoaspartate O-methyltransferase [Lysobacter caseinilyticus]BCT95804.1 protein-L-isoaspartate O-methyltransferase [Lysobacter helvus]
MTIDYAKARETMVEQQVRPWDVLDARVLDALVMVPRDAFVPSAHRALAYADAALPLGHGESMMKPVVEGRVLQALDVQAGEDVLEIGTGSGFLTACLGRLAREVHSIELHAEFADAARARLDTMGLGGNVRIEAADAFSWDTDRRYDAICVTGAVEAIPPRFLQWLRPGGRLFVVRGVAPAMEAVLVRNDVNGPGIESLFETDLNYLAGAAPVAKFDF